MEIEIRQDRPVDRDADVLMVTCCAEDPDVEPLAQALDGRLDSALAELRGSGELSGRLHEQVLYHVRGEIAARRVLFAGLGARSAVTVDTLRQAAGHAAKRVAAVRARSLAVVLPDADVTGVGVDLLAQAVVEGVILGGYRFDHYRGKAHEAPPELASLVLLAGSAADSAAVREGAERGEAVGRAAAFSRDLCNHPGNVMTPTRLAEEAVAISAETSIKVRVLDVGDMEALGMGGLLGVARGSREPPKLIVLEYDGRGPAAAAGGGPLVLVGKAVTFDTGGVSLKVALDMHHMKADMTGGANVLAAMRGAARLRLPLHLIGLVPATENTINGRALKPGDILTIMDGTTVEVQNTDAEGRLILADALAYAARLEPELIVDMATLTGASSTALGRFAIGMFGTDDRAKQQLRDAGAVAGEPVWEMPLWEAYAEQLESYVADLRNIGGPEAGMITAALFLSRFTGSRPWVHLDNYSSCWSDRERACIARGPTASGARLLLQFLIDRCQSQAGSAA